jgi:hypothetical protein
MAGHSTEIGHYINFEDTMAGLARTVVYSIRIPY